MIFLLAAAGSSTSSPTIADVVGGLLQYGPLGIFVVLYITGQIVSKRDYDRVIRERDEEKTYSRGLEQKLRDEIVPLLGKATDATTNAVQVITETRAVRRMKSTGGT